MIYAMLKADKSGQNEVVLWKAMFVIYLINFKLVLSEKRM
jgi:hypothetical protein